MGSSQTRVPENDELLSQNTARLSISLKEDAVINQVREFLQGEALQRRDSAVSLTSFDDDMDKPETLVAANSASKRRRSSVQLVQQPKPKKLKEHKRKKQKALEPLMIELSSKGVLLLELKQLRPFLLELLLGSYLNERKLLRVNKLHKVTKVVFAFVPGLLQSDFASQEPTGEIDARPLSPKVKDRGVSKNSLSFFYNTFDNLLPTTMVGSKDSVFLCPQALVSFPVSKGERKKRAEELRKTKIVLYDLLVTMNQMEQNNYPIHSTLDPASTLPQGWVETRKFDHEGSHTFALDCEFCQSKTGLVLTRVSMVNFQNEVVYDTFVKPQEEITDYVTRFSGITKEILEDVSTTADDVQKRILELVSSDDILIGHSLESDLNVMKIRHPNIIDTSLIYDHSRGPPLKPGLKWLAEKHLARLIQQGEQTGKGHSSIEDLTACLDLVKMKLIEGPGFGKMIRETTLFEKVYEKQPHKKSIIVDYYPDVYGTDLGEEINLEKFPVLNDDEVVEIVSRELDATSLMLTRFKEIDFNSGVTSVPNKFTGELQCELNENRKTTSLTGECREQCLLRLNVRLQKVYDLLPEGSVFIVCSEGGDMKEMSDLQAVRRRFQQLERKQVNLSEIPPEECWDFDKQAALTRATLEARKGIAFATIKSCTGISELSPSPEVNDKA